MAGLGRSRGSLHVFLSRTARARFGFWFWLRRLDPERETSSILNCVICEVIIRLAFGEASVAPQL